MNNVFTSGAIAAVAFMMGSMMTAGGSQISPQVTLPAIPSIVEPCVTGFEWRTHHDGSPNYRCITSYDSTGHLINCPQKPGMISNTKGSAPMNTGEGVRFIYECTYQKPPG